MRAEWYRLSYVMQSWRSFGAARPVREKTGKGTAWNSLAWFVVDYDRRTGYNN